MMSQQDNKEMAKYFYRASAADFGKLPGRPVAYWVSHTLRSIFENSPRLDDISPVRVGLQTGSNDKFVRVWHEVSLEKSSLSLVDGQHDFRKKWFPYNKGGEYRKWYGNNENIVNWYADGDEIRNFSNESGKLKSRPQNIDYYFKESITWSFVSSSHFGVRLSDTKAIFDVAGSSAFPSEQDKHHLTGLLCSKLAPIFMGAMNPTLNFQVGNVSAVPVVNKDKIRFNTYLVRKLVGSHKSDWNSFEISWEFTGLPLILFDNHQPNLKFCYQELRNYWNKTVLEMQRLEEENNRLFIEAYGLQDELTPEVPLSEITLTCNPHYRYGGNLTDEEREALLQSDTIAELVSYAIGCMMGRYSLDREGLVYAHAGNVGFNDLVAEEAYKTFAADGDGILPLTSEHWFEDDIAARIEEFVRTVWGAETLEENLQFIADSLCLYAIKPPKKGGETSRETIRRYLSTQFFKDHLKTYKKRPIYWLFSSGKEKAFECLVYLHRYNEATLPRMRTEYVTPLLGQMASRIERLRLQQADASTAEAKRLDKQIDGLTKQLAELRAFDDQLKHHADMKITLDLDDGVKVNYGKFGTLLSDVKAITGDKGE